MKRRYFFTRSAIGIATGAILPATVAASENSPTSVANATTTEQGIRDKIHLVNNEPSAAIQEVMQYCDVPRSGVVLGGIGAGGAEIRKDGIWYNWSAFNNNPKGSGAFLLGTDPLFKDGEVRSVYPHEPGEILNFKVRYQVGDEEPRMKIFQINNSYFSNNIAMPIYEFPWLSGVDSITYKARFPFAWLQFSDPDMPFDVVMETWSPFVPGDIKNSALPLLFFKFTVQSKSEKPIEVTLEATLRNMTGYDTADKFYTSKIVPINAHTAYEVGAGRLAATESSFGSMGMASLHPDTTYHLGWSHRHTYHEKFLRNPQLPNIDSTEGRNYGKNKKGEKTGEPKCFNALAVYNSLQPNASFTAEFIMGWHFPNNYDDKKEGVIGHYYDNFFNNSTDVLKYAIDNKAMLYDKTKAFYDHFYASTVPVFVLDQVNSQLTTFITSSILSKTKDFGILEGITPHQSWGPVGTTDVNMYGGVMVTSLFPELQKSTMRIHKKLQHEGGEIRHSFEKGMSKYLPAVAGVSERLDLPAQYVVMVMRDFFWTNDKAYLQEFWPSIKKAISYVLNHRDLNGDQQPDMTGIMCSYDNFAMYGMASYIQGQWLCAMASAMEGAKVMGDVASEKLYKQVFEKGRKLANEKLWNGQYFRLYNSDLKTLTTKDGAGKEVVKDMAGIDEGCLTDQVIGQWAAHWSGLGYIFEKEHTHTAMDNILKMSYKPNFGLRNCSWPGDKYWHPIADDVWVDQANTCWSGVELSFASFLLYEGKYEAALQVIKTVDTRYRKAGRYFDHQEFGGHYFRAMGAWSIINGLAGLSINQGDYTIAPQVPGNDYKLFVAFPGATVHVERNGNNFSIKVLSGVWSLNRLSIILSGDISPTRTAMVNGKTYLAAIDKQGQFSFNFNKELLVRESDVISIK